MHSTRDAATVHFTVPGLQPRLAALRGRSLRVTVAIGAIVLLSLADLVITMLYLKSVGMSEGNPVARWVIAMNSPALLVAFKMLLVGIGCWIFYQTRHFSTSEAGAWCCCAILLWLMLQWVQYSDSIGTMTPVIHQMGQTPGSTWVQYGPPTMP